MSPAAELPPVFAGRAFGVLRWILGIFLLVTAGLKLYGLGVASVPRVGPFSAPGLQLAVILWEIILGGWLLSGRHLLASWLAACVTFVAFAAASSYLGWIGLAHCGCFGAIKASPWQAFAVDVLMLLTLAWARPKFRLLRVRPRAVFRDAARPFLTAGVVSALLFGMIAGMGVWGFGSLDAAVAYLRGERISLRPDQVDMGRGAPGQIVEATVELTNRTARPVRIIGGTSDCSCWTTEDLPILLNPGESQAVSIRIRMPQATGLYNRTAFFWTDDDEARTIVFQLTGRVVPPQKEASQISRE